jgi:hypothetical protein
MLLFFAYFWFVSGSFLVLPTISMCVFVSLYFLIALLLPYFGFGINWRTERNQDYVTKIPKGGGFISER